MTPTLSVASLSAIALDRPAFYGRTLPVLLSLEPSSSVVNGVCVSAAHLALKNAFLTCSKCTHPSAAPVYSSDQDVLEILVDLNAMSYFLFFLFCLYVAMLTIFYIFTSWIASNFPSPPCIQKIWLLMFSIILFQHFACPPVLLSGVMACLFCGKTSF